MLARRLLHLLLRSNLTWILVYEHPVLVLQAVFRRLHVVGLVQCRRFRLAFATSLLLLPILVDIVVGAAAGRLPTVVEDWLGLRIRADEERCLLLNEEYRLVCDEVSFDSMHEISIRGVHVLPIVALPGGLFVFGRWLVWTARRLLLNEGQPGLLPRRRMLKRCLFDRHAMFQLLLVLHHA